MISSYPKVRQLGDRWIANIFMGDPEIQIEEKVDGSQFSFRVDEDGKLFRRSRGKQECGKLDKMFDLAIATVENLNNMGKIPRCMTFRCEYLSKPKHNAIAYARVPKHNLVLFDVMTDHGIYMDWESKNTVAQDLDIDCIPLLHCGKQLSLDDMKALLDRESYLGGHKIEGIVIKNHETLDPYHQPMMGKIVSDEFKEKMTGKIPKDQRLGFVNNLILQNRTEARWNKSIQRVKESGDLGGDMKDIPLILKDLHIDFEEEERGFIKEALYKHYMPLIKKGICQGFGDWYRKKLMGNVMGVTEDTEDIKLLDAKKFGLIDDSYMKELGFKKS